VCPVIDDGQDETLDVNDIMTRVGDALQTTEDPARIWSGWHSARGCRGRVTPGHERPSDHQIPRLIDHHHVARRALGFEGVSERGTLLDPNGDDTPSAVRCSMVDGHRRRRGDVQMSIQNCSKVLRMYRRIAAQ